MVECDLAKVDVASSNLVSRSKRPASLPAFRMMGRRQRRRPAMSRQAKSHGDEPITTTRDFGTDAMSR